MQIFNIWKGYIWKNVCVQNKVYDIGIAEFNFKLLNDIKDNNVCVSKCNKEESPFCTFCNLEKDIKYL